MLVCGASSFVNLMEVEMLWPAALVGARRVLTFSAKINVVLSYGANKNDNFEIPHTSSVRVTNSRIVPYSQMPAFNLNLFIHVQKNRQKKWHEEMHFMQSCQSSPTFKTKSPGSYLYNSC